VIPSVASTRAAKSAFSARNPYPGWIASAPAASGVDDRLAVEVRVGRARRPHVVRFVRVSDVAAVFVRVAVDGDRVDAQLLAGTHHPHRDLAPVGD